MPQELDETDIPEFGFLPFDHFVIALWDPESPLSRQEQKRALVDKWIRLGKSGRGSFMQEDIPYPEDIPSYVPRDLLSSAERAVDGEKSSTLFIRTWFGQPGDKTSQDAADAAYSRLRVAVMQQGDPDASNDCMDEEFIFEDRDELGAAGFEGAGEDVVDGVAVGRAGSVPGYLATALLHCPDQFDGTRVYELREFALSEGGAEAVAERDKEQSLLVLVADRTACEEGWVLHLAVNHRGQVLPFRVRDQATMVSTNVGSWLNGEALAENTLDPEEETVHYMREGDGWE